MRLFSRRSNKVKRTGKRLLLVSGCMMALFMMAPVSTQSFTGSMTAYAAEVTQSARWAGNGNDWRVSDNKGGFLKNCWFQDDVTNHWYLLGGGDGSLMYAGLVTDNSTNKSYYLNVNHDGTYGRMVTADGVYNINGKDVYLTFNQSHDGTFGAITSGLSEARATGVTESKRDNIPTEDNNKTENNNNNPGGGGGGFAPIEDDISGGYTVPEKEIYVP